MRTFYHQFWCIWHSAMLKSLTNEPQAAGQREHHQERLHYHIKKL